MRQTFHRIIATILIVLTLGAIARADQSTAAQQASPSAASTPGNSPAPKKQEAQELNPVVVTATKIEQPISEIGTTITVVEDSQIEAQKIDRVGDVLREVPGVQVTQTGSPGTATVTPFCAEHARHTDATAAAITATRIFKLLMSDFPRCGC